MIVVRLCAAHVPWRPLHELTERVRMLVQQLFSQATMLDLALFATSAGLGEELLFRGFLQGSIARWTDPWTALAIASAVFGLVHLITPTYGVLAGLLGAYLGGLWLATDNLLAPIVAHALYDFVALVYLLRTGSREAKGSPVSRV
jgi:membrane protease YdiL (CAAX protease family)